MIEELIKRLQERRLSEQQEIELIAEMDRAKEVIAKNQTERRIEQAKFEELQKDEVKVKNLDEINSKIAERKNEIIKLDNRNGVFMLLYALLLVGGIIGIVTSTTIGFLSNLSFLQVFLVGCAYGFIGIVGMFPLGKFMGKNRKILLNELQKLNEEKKQMLDEINVDIEKLAIDNLKLTNLPKLTKNTERTNEQVITEETINTI